MSLAFTEKKHLVDKNFYFSFKDVPEAINMVQL